jgi:hypothetical protein
MIPLVSHKTGYIIYYNPKVACTYLRILFLRLHEDELTDAQKRKLNRHHNIRKMFGFINGQAINYDSFESFVVVRNPFDRIVSSWVDKIALVPSSSDLDLIPASAARFVGKLSEGDLNFCDLLNFFRQQKISEGIKDGSFNEHLCSQSATFDKYLPKKILHADTPEVLRAELWNIYSEIFRTNSEKFQVASEYLERADPVNVTGFCNNNFDSELPESDLLTIDNLWALAQAKRLPPRSSFLTVRTIPLIRTIYKNDFQIYQYPINREPYLYSSKVDPDKYVDRVCQQLKVNVKPRSLPDDFDDELYLQLNPGLRAARVDPKRHYLNCGIREGRQYK